MVGARPLRVGRPRTERASRPRRAQVSLCGGSGAQSPGDVRRRYPAIGQRARHRVANGCCHGPPPTHTDRGACSAQAMLVDGSRLTSAVPVAPTVRHPRFAFPPQTRVMRTRRTRTRVQRGTDAWRGGGPLRAGAAARDRGWPHFPRCTRAVERSWRRWGPSPCHTSRRSWSDQTKGASVSSTACEVRRRTIPPWHTPTLPVAEGSEPPTTSPRSPPHAAGPPARFSCMHERVLGLGIHAPLHGTPLHRSHGTDLAVQSYRTSLRGDLLSPGQDRVASSHGRDRCGSLGRRGRK